jgi:hypothetical protein
MGIDKTKTKLTAFALGATWAGMAGTIFAAKTTFINPASFTIWESIIILCIVVLGGMGSILGVTLGALVLILLPEYLRAFSEYRMLIFGAVLVLMMVFRPGGIVIALSPDPQISVTPATLDTLPAPSKAVLFRFSRYLSNAHPGEHPPSRRGNSDWVCWRTRSSALRTRPPGQAVEAAPL